MTLRIEAGEIQLNAVMGGPRYMRQIRIYKNDRYMSGKTIYAETKDDLSME